MNCWLVFNLFIHLDQHKAIADFSVKFEYTMSGRRPMPESTAKRGKVVEAHESSSDSEDSGPEEHSNDEGTSDYSDDEGDDGELDHSSSTANEDIPLYKRLALQNSDEVVTAVAREMVKQRRIRDSAKGNEEFE